MVDTFIVRIYRRDEGGKPLVGLVEDSRAGTTRAFGDAAELWKILSGSTGRRKKRAPDD